MDRRITLLIAGLVAAVAGLAIALGLVIASDDDDEGPRMTGTMDMIGESDDHFAGMMQAMRAMDSDLMLGHMREVLGPDGYQRMLDHFAEHGDGPAMEGDATIDGMMHGMMDGMMQHMPADGDGAVPPASDSHHETPSP